MKVPKIRDINRKTSIPKEDIIRAVEKVYGVKLDGLRRQVKQKEAKAK